MGKDELKTLIREIVKEVISEVGIQSTKSRLSLEEAVEFLCFNGYPTTKSKVYKLSNEIPRDRINGKLSFLRADLQNWVDKQTTPANNKTEVALGLARAARRKAKTA